MFVFFAVWSVLLCGLFGCLFVLLFGRGRVVFFAVWAGAGAPPKQQNKHALAQTAKKKTPRPLRAFLFVLFGRVGVFFFAVGAGGLFFYCLGGGRVFFCGLGAGVFLFCCLGGGHFCCLGGGHVFLCCLGRGPVCFFAVCAGGVFFLGVHSLTGLPGLSLRDPTTKKTKQQKKKHTHGFQPQTLNPKPS